MTGTATRAIAAKEYTASSIKAMVGPIPAGFQLDHVKARGCAWTDCCNPAHLEAVPPIVNWERGTVSVAAQCAEAAVRQRARVQPGEHLPAAQRAPGLPRLRTEPGREVPPHHPGAALPGRPQAGSVNTRDAAVAAARRGFFVFPCRRDGDLDQHGKPAAKLTAGTRLAAARHQRSRGGIEELAGPALQRWHRLRAEPGGGRGSRSSRRP